jgi:hypothetical protein
LPTLRFSNRSVGNHVHNATRRAYAHQLETYSPNLVELDFVHLGRIAKRFG